MQTLARHNDHVQATRNLRLYSKRSLTFTLNSWSVSGLPYYVTILTVHAAIQRQH